jgi:hypothetical protein
MPVTFRAAVLTLGFCWTTIGHAQLPLPPDTLSPDRMKAHLQYQWRLLLITSILNARDHGQNASDLGRSAGRWISQRWGSELQPQEFGRAIEVRFRRLGFGTQIMEDTDSAFTFYWSAIPDSAAFYRTYGSWGIRVADLEDCITAVQLTISDNSNILWTPGLKDSWRVARITRKAQSPTKP